MNNTPFKFRQIRFRLQDGRIVIVKDRVNTRADIQKWIDRFHPVDCYYCYDNETEVLTKNGWKRFVHVTLNDEILSMNPETYDMEYLKPTRKITNRYTGKMIAREGNMVDFKVTANHQMFVRTRGGRQRFRFDDANNINKQWIFKSNGNWVGTKTSFFYLPSITITTAGGRGTKVVERRTIPLHNWLEFFGWWLAEGYATQNGVGRYRVVVSQKKFFDEAHEAVKGIGFRFSVQTQPSGVKDIVIISKQLFSYLSQFGHAHQKFVPEFIKQLSPKSIEVFLNAFWRGDGYAGKNGQRCYVTTSKTLADDLQELVLKIGKSATIGRAARLPPRHDVYTVWTNNKSEHGIRGNSTISFVEQNVVNETTYCLELPKFHLMYVRRHFKPIWCGNSTSLWRDPLRMHGTRSIGDYMGSDYCIDIDAHSGNLKMAALDTKQIWDIIKVDNRNFPNPKLAFTGRGFRITFEGYRGIDMTQDAKERQKLLRYLGSFGFDVNGFTSLPEFDVQTFLDQYRVIRVLNTYNSRAGLPCVEIQERNLDDLAWVDLLPRQPVWEPRRKKQDPFWSVGISSKVIGTKNRNALMFDFDEKSLEWIRERLTKISNTYGLGGDYLILETSENRFSVISPTCVETARLKKILRASGCHPAFVNRFEMFHHVFIRLQPKYRIPDNAQLVPEPSPTELFSIGVAREASLGHHAFLSRLFDLNSPLRFVGLPTVELRKYTKNAEKSDQTVAVPDWDVLTIE